MFHLILTACLAGNSAICAPILLPAGDGADQAACAAQAARITGEWLAAHPDLRDGGSACQPANAVETLAVGEIAPGVFTHIGTVAQIAEDNAGRIANLSFVVGDTVAVIDAGASRAEGQALYAAIRAVTDKPVSHLILTHMHPDHVFGASVFAEAGAKIIGHAALPQALEARGGAYLDNFDRIVGAQGMIGTTIVMPDETAPPETTIDLGTTRLILTPVPTAHTDNDLMVRDETSNTLFTGDLIFRGLTPVVDGSLNGWLAWMNLPPQPEPALIVPGHGPVATTWHDAAAAQQEFLTALRDATRATIADDQPMSAAVPHVLDQMQPLVGDWAEFDDTVRRDATAAYKELEWE